MSESECPARFCFHAFTKDNIRPEEMVIHLKWSHGMSENQARQLVDKPRAETGTEPAENVDGGSE